VRYFPVYQAIRAFFSLPMSFSVTDQTGYTVQLALPPQRIISLVPSQTELLYDLQAGHRVVGITRYCVHPTQWQTEKTIVGGTKNFNMKVIESLKPDLILGNKEENYQAGIEYLRPRFPVWLSDIVSLEDALQMITDVSALTATDTRGTEIRQRIQKAFSGTEKYRQKKVLYLIWRKPWMAAGPGTFIHSMLEKIGLINIISDPRYPKLSDEEIRSLNPELVFLSSEPFPFQDKHIEEVRKMLPASKILLVDGEMFSWYGSRLLGAPAYLNSLPLDRS
jgi:ABC-type Fe3+-hydroxamate transport system substrate-binding protein